MTKSKSRTSKLEGHIKKLVDSNADYHAHKLSSSFRDNHYLMIKGEAATAAQQAITSIIREIEAERVYYLQLAIKCRKKKRYPSQNEISTLTGECPVHLLEIEK